MVRMGSTVFCTNCGELLEASKGTFLSMNEIHNRIRRRNLPFVPSLYSLLGMTIEDGMQNFADIILEGKNEFEEYNSLIIMMDMANINDNHFIFEDNFFDWVDDKLPASDVLFKPSAIIQMTNFLNTYPSVRNASQWSYDKESGDFYCLWTQGKVEYFADYPFRAEISKDSTDENPRWTETSGIYLCDDPNYLIDQLSYNLLQRVDEYSGQISLAGFSSNFNYDKTISRLEKRIEENRYKTEDVYTKWRNR